MSEQALQENKYQYQFEQIKSGYIPDRAYSESEKEYGMAYYSFLAKRISFALVIIDAFCFLFAMFTICGIYDSSARYYDYDRIGHQFAVYFLLCGLAVFCTSRMFSKFQWGSMWFYNLTLAVNAVIFIVFHHTIYRMPTYDYFHYERIMEILAEPTIGAMDEAYLYAFAVSYIINLIGICLALSIIPNICYCNTRGFLYK